MQDKLNEILELCVEKSKDGVFYSFAYHNLSKYVWVHKFNAENKPLYFNSFNQDFFTIKIDNANQALEYMQNE